MKIFTSSLSHAVRKTLKRMISFAGAFILLFAAFNNVNAQNAIVGTGFTSGWGTACVNDNNYIYFSFDAGTSLSSGVLTPNGTGNQYWRFGVGWGGVFKQLNLNNAGTDVNVMPNMTYTLDSTCVSNGAMFTDVSSVSNRYIFKTRDATEHPTGDFVMFALSGAPITVSSVSQSPDSVQAGQNVTISGTLSGPLPTGQGIWVRYTTDNFLTSFCSPLTVSGTTYSGMIPAAVNTSATHVIYYVFTSGTPAAISHNDAAFYTINGNYNNGANYGYTVKAAFPVKLISFTGEHTGNRNMLSWVTASEENNAGFELQRSANGADFSKLAFIATKANSGTSNERLTYSYVDEAPFAATGYYRLKQINKDGKFTYSDVVLIKGTKAASVILSAVYPSPAVNTLHVVISSPNTGKVAIAIMDVTGKVVMQTNAQLSAGDNNLNLNVAAIAKGIYTLKVIQANNSNNKNVKFVKQ